MKSKLSNNVSVIIPARNEAKIIAKIIKAFQNQSLPPQEIIVVGDACTDKTAEIAKQAGAKVLEKNYRSAAKARNAGIKQAKGEILAIQDADALPSDNYLEEIVKAVESGADYGGAKLITESWQPVGKLQMLFFNLAAYFYGGFQGSSLFAKKSLLAKTNLYNPDVPWAEDWELSTQLRKLGSWKLLTNAQVTYSERKMKQNGYLREYGQRLWMVGKYIIHQFKQTLAKRN
jgi:glycosyltransferase involved in cell wall biosynthesis